MRWVYADAVWWLAGRRGYVIASEEREGMWFAEAQRIQQFFDTLEEAKAWVEAVYALKN